MRKIAEFKTIDDLGLEPLCKTIAMKYRYSPEELVMAVRLEQPKSLRGFGRKRVESLVRTIQEAGLIMKESKMSYQVRQYLWNILAYGDMTAEEYEAQSEVPREHIEQFLRLLLCDFRPRDVDIIALKYGLNGDDPMETAEIARKYGISSSRVLQIIYEIERKLRHLTRRQQLAEIFPELPWIMEARKTAR